MRISTHVGIPGLDTRGGGRPTLNLNFVGADRLDPQITFTRASTATYFNSAGVLSSAAINEARFDYNPATLAARGLRIEEQRTNSYTYSEDLSNPAWTENQVTVSANAAVAPDGQTTADNVVPKASSDNFKEVQQNFSATTGTSYSFSVFVKANGYQYVQLIGTSAQFGTFAVNYDLISGTETQFTAGTSTVLGRSITSVGNGWYRITVSATAIGTSATSRLSCDIIPALDSARGVNWSSDGVSGVLMWGFQIETGTFPTSYIPTTTTALTRSADLALVNTVSPWFNATEGTLFAEAELPVPGATGIQTKVAVGLSDGTTNNRVTVGRGSAADNARNIVTSGGVNQNGTSGQSIAGVFASSNTAKLALAYATDNVATAGNGILSVATPPNALPIGINLLSIGNRYDTNAGTSINGWVQRVTYYPRRLSDAELQTITA